MNAIREDSIDLTSDPEDHISAVKPSRSLPTFMSAIKRKAVAVVAGDQDADEPAAVRGAVKKAKLAAEPKANRDKV